MSLPRIKLLPGVIKKNKFIYHQMVRTLNPTPNKALYSQYNGSGKLIGYEVFKIKLGKPHPNAMIDLENFDQVERFPNDEDFGKTAWNYKCLDQAMLAFDGK